jgi:hypothetical protein
MLSGWGWLIMLTHFFVGLILNDDAADPLLVITGWSQKLMQAIQPARMLKFSALLGFLWEQCPRRFTALDGSQCLSV